MPDGWLFPRGRDVVPAGGQKGGTKRSRLAPKEPQAPEPSADAADNTAAVPEVCIHTIVTPSQEDLAQAT